ncbi:hypothetical protein FHS43_005521 [Streptosporangium becharense]|uniref:Uncharacterized protein n=1 Tax=Streptosporangium becharense TaxID=1816182 RepID=A0A7W9IBK1_9ACTN|nr:hypothetical protein [Streptosporangium becharense]MBB2914209.1 hypothetical protein [Streptosporangium becharense]MBB5817236.1 hypothetical protein [Streptosporangium becharense]
MRPRVIACLPVLLLSLSACGGSPELKTAPAAAGAGAPAASVSSAPPVYGKSAPWTNVQVAWSSPKRVFTGSGAACGKIRLPQGTKASIKVVAGRVSCGTALRVFRTYYRPSTPKQGSGAAAVVAGWYCSSASAAEASAGGRLSTCQKGGVRIVANAVR